MARCPYCTYETPEPDDGDATARAWQEIAHMELEHKDVLHERFEKMGILDMTMRFGEDDN